MCKIPDIVLNACMGTLTSDVCVNWLSSRNFDNRSTIKCWYCEIRGKDCFGNLVWSLSCSEQLVKLRRKKTKIDKGKGCSDKD